MLKWEWGSESNGKLPHLFIPSKIATLVPELAVEHLSLGRTVALVPELKWKTCPWAKVLIFNDWYIINLCMHIYFHEPPLRTVYKTKHSHVMVSTIIKKFSNHHHHHHHHHRQSVMPKRGLSLPADEPRLQFCRRQVFHRKLRKQGCSLPGIE